MAIKKVNQHRSPRVIEGSNRYLVRLDSSLFYLRTAGDGKPLGVSVPSAAWHGSYAEADAVCQKFRALSYSGPAVTDIFGRMIDNQALADERARLEEKSRKFWGE
jgi:hypothetical protein